LYTLEKYKIEIEKLFGEKLIIPSIHINELIAIMRGCEEEKCFGRRNKNLHLHKIYKIITQL